MAGCGANDHKAPPERHPRSTPDDEKEEEEVTGELAGAATPSRPSTAPDPSKSLLTFFKWRRRRGRAWLTAALFLVVGVLVIGRYGWAANDAPKLRLRAAPDQERRRDPPLQESLEKENNQGGSEEGLTKRYGSFKEFALEEFSNTNNEEALRVPVVASPDEGPEAILSLPVAIIIGVQKGGTQNLRSHLLTHPQLSGQSGKEIHFFDWHWFPEGLAPMEWPGDGHESEKPLTAAAAGGILRSYAERSKLAVAPTDRRTKVSVDSSPLYAFHPLVPYRMKMVLPHARIILLLRDPTDRYYSQLRMTMCWVKKGGSFEATEKKTASFFHRPGKAEKYLEQAEASYEPYTPLCRGEGATAADLERCYFRSQKYSPLYRGVYAEQLDRWFRVFDRSQILVVESGEMFRDFMGTLDAVAQHAGLPPHDFEYDSVFQHSSDGCEERRPDLFAPGEWMDKMREEEKLFRDWYRPHNQRLYELLGRELAWE